jgi:hypothetical protein
MAGADRLAPGDWTENLREAGTEKKWNPRQSRITIRHRMRIEPIRRRCTGRPRKGITKEVVNFLLSEGANVNK